MTVLIVGATGQLGSATLRELVQHGVSVRALVRRTSNYRRVGGSAELAFGDLGELDSLLAACTDIEAVIATASSIVPRAGDRFGRVEDVGYANLIQACQRRGVGQLILISVPVTALDARVPTYRTKRMIESRLFASGVRYTVFRSALFMDVYLAVMGSGLPLRGAQQATLRRPFWFTRLTTAG
ncbi:MAG: NAD(P)H-binding protein, partial [Chloroflexi bacterium]|nr:NAD(P)H-binding protein [Chloroflexota bacterium]